jgi:hypothetical protein
MLHRLSTGMTALALLGMSLGCATGVHVEGSGGDSATSTSGAGGMDAGMNTGPCTTAAECIAMTDACNVGTCVNGTCVKGPANDLAPCNDGLFCTENDACNNGVCVGGSARYCATADACHVGACDEATDTCTEMPGNDGAQCDDMDICTLQGTCSAGACSKGSPVNCSIFDGPCTVGLCDPMAGCKPAPANDGSPCDDALFCTINDQCQSGTCAGAPNPCAPPGGCYIASCDEVNAQCSAVPGNDGQPCDDGNSCSKGTTCLSGACINGQPDNEGAMCDDGSACTSMTSCTSGVCGGGVGPTVYFADDFHDKSKGWILGPEWEIGPAMVSSGEDSGYPDPGLDHTPTGDNGVAGVAIGGNEYLDPFNPIHPYYYLESPPFNTANAAGQVILGFQRWLNSDYADYMHNTVDVWDGVTWVNLWTSDFIPVEDQAWTFIQYDLTPYKNASMKIRFGFDIGEQFNVYLVSSWNIDDVLVASAACP